MLPKRAQSEVATKEIAASMSAARLTMTTLVARGTKKVEKRVKA